MTILHLAERIKEITNSTSVIECHPLPVDDPKVRQPDITRAKELLGWEPRVSFEDGIQATIENFRQRLDTGEESFPLKGRRADQILARIRAAARAAPLPGR